MESTLSPDRGDLITTTLPRGQWLKKAAQMVKIHCQFHFFHSTISIYFISVLQDKIEIVSTTEGKKAEMCADVLRTELDKYQERAGETAVSWGPFSEWFFCSI